MGAIFLSKSQFRSAVNVGKMPTSREWWVFWLSNMKVLHCAFDDVDEV